MQRAQFDRYVAALLHGSGWGTLAAVGANAHYLDVEGSTLATVTGVRPGATLTSSVSQVVVDGSDLEMGAGTGTSGFRANGTYAVQVAQSYGGASLKQDAAITVLPTGVNMGDAWTPFVRDVYVSRGWVQESLSPGAVSSWPSIGYRTTAATQATGALQPAKLAGTGGVEFAAVSDQNLVYPGNSMRWVEVRACLTIARVDKTTGTGSTKIVIPQGDNTAAQNQSGALIYRKSDDAVRSIWRDESLSTNEIKTTGISPDYATWFFVVRYHRDGKLYAKFNGGAAQVAATTRFNPGRSESGETGFLGAGSNASGGNSKFAIDCHLDLTGAAISDEIIAKLEWWAAQRAGIMLPVGHPYRSVSAVVDSADFPATQHEYFPAEWARTAAIHAARSSSNRGGSFPASVEAAFSVPVFMDDFRIDSAVNGNTTSLDGIWYSLGGLAGNTVGIDATLRHTTDSPDMYPHDPTGQTLSVRAYTTGGGSKQAGAMSTVNRVDSGRTFQGPMLWRVRFKLTSNVAWTPYYFPCPLWFYSAQRSYMPISVVSEVDIVEIDTLDGDYLNGISLHQHAGIGLTSVNGRPGGDATSYKFAAHNMTSPSYPTPVDFLDGQWHEAVLAYDEFNAYFGVDGMEVVRFETPRILLDRLHAIINNAIRNGSPANLDYCDMAIDYVMAFKRPSDVALIPTPFTARPTIGGTAQVGQTLTITSNLPASVSQLRYEWYYDDGYPLFAQRNGTYVVQAGDVGKRLRCKVLAVSHYEQPEAWSDLTSVVIA